MSFKPSLQAPIIAGIHFVLTEDSAPRTTRMPSLRTMNSGLRKFQQQRKRVAADLYAHKTASAASYCRKISDVVPPVPVTSV
jgi:hypothetical protein